MEAPEEEVDDRSLYHRLQEQKMAKEAEKAEEHKLRNMVQGLKKDETDFLDFVATKQMQVRRNGSRLSKPMRVTSCCPCSLARGWAAVHK